MSYLINQPKIRKIWSYSYPYLIILAAAIFILLPQHANKAFFIGADTVFHMNRFYESAMQIKTGHFSWFLTLYGFNRAGRIVNAVYGPIFSYLMGALLLICGSWYRFQILTSFLVLFISGSLTYHLSRYCRINRSISLFLGLLYLSSFPVDTWTNEQTFSGVGAAFMPLVILEGIKLIRSHDINIIPFALLITFFAQIHILSTLIAIMALAPFVAVSFYKCQLKKKWLKKFLVTIILTLGLTGNIWGSLLEVIKSNHIITPFPEKDMVSSAYSIAWENGDLSLLSNIYIIIGIITIAMIVIERNRFSLIQKLNSWVCFAFLWLSSSYFPWESLSKKFPMIQQDIQFPKRFMSVFVILLLLIFGKGINLYLKDYGSNNLRLLAVIMLIFISVISISEENHSISTHTDDWRSNQVSVTTNSYHPKVPPEKLRDSLNSHNLTTGVKYFEKSTPDYLPTSYKINANNFQKMDPYDLLTNEILRVQLKRFHTRSGGSWYGVRPLKNRIRFHKSFHNGKLTIKWRQPPTKRDRLVTLPVIKYRHTKLWLNHHLIHKVKVDRIGGVILPIKGGNNQINLQYSAPTWFKFVITLTIVCWLLIIVIDLLKTNSIKKFMPKDFKISLRKIIYSIINRKLD